MKIPIGQVVKYNGKNYTIGDLFKGKFKLMRPREKPHWVKPKTIGMQPGHKKIHWATFIKTYRPIKNHLAKGAPFDGLMFETIGKEMEFMKKQDYHNVWTLVQAEDTYLALNGFHWVNRLGYFITKIPWMEGQEIESST